MNNLVNNKNNLNDYYKVAEQAVTDLDLINDRIEEISKELKEYQPPISGRLTLELWKCTKKGCLSCPHHKWMVWKTIHTKYGTESFASKSIDDPWRRIKASGEFKENYEYIKALVLEARSLLKEKEYYTKGFQKLRVAVKRNADNTLF